MGRVLFLGVDVGTNSSKGVLIDRSGTVVARESIPHRMENPKPGYYEHDAESVWWHDFCFLSRKLLISADASSDEVAGIGVSTLGSDCLPVDRECRPLRKAILYGIDSRSTSELKELTEFYGEELIKKEFGRPLVTGDVAGKILWIRKNEPEIYNRTYKFLTGSSFLVAKLTGEYVIDSFLGVASFRPFYASDGSIRGEFCEPCCRSDQLAIGRRVTDIAGVVSAAAAEETGLKEGTPVITGTGDSAAEAISVGVLSPGDIMVQFGSTLFFYACTDSLIQDDRVRGNTFTIPGTYSITAGTNNSGTLQNWYREILFPDCIKIEQTLGPNSFEQMMKGIDLIPPGAEGLVTLPYFMGERTPVNDPDARGIIFGLTTKHTRQHLYRSALESIGYSVRQHLEIFMQNGMKIRTIRAAGGGAKNHYWMQMVADITGFPVELAEETEGAAYGDALMSAIGTGYYSSFSDLKNIVKIQECLVPREDLHRQYQPYYKLYLSLYPHNKTLLHSLHMMCNS